MYLYYAYTTEPFELSADLAAGLRTL